MASPSPSAVEEPEDGRRRIKSIEVGFRTLRVLEAAGGYMPLGRIAAAAGMPVSKAYTYLLSFMREEMVHQDPVSGHYGLGKFAVQIGLSAVRNLDIVALAREDIKALRDRTQCGVSLAIWSNRGPTILLKADGPDQGGMTIRVGHGLSPLRSASGRLYRAYLSEVETAAALRTAGDLPPGEAELRAAIRRQGFAVNEPTPSSAFAAVAAPVFDVVGGIAAAVTVLATPSSQHTEHGALYREELLAATARLSAKLGYVPPPTHTGG